MGFVAAVYTYSISAVKQDDFSDLPSTNPNAGQEGIKTIEEELAEKGTRMGAQRGVGALMGYGSSPQGTGVRVANEPATVAGMHDTQPASSPQPTPLSSPLIPSSSASVAAGAAVSTTASPYTRPSSKFIIGAPDVDRIGRLGERSDQESTIDGKRVA
jgi:cytochrome c oxidase assembly factor 3